MNVELIDSVEEFIALTTSFRAADPLRTNVIGSVALAVSTGRTIYDGCHWWIVRDDDRHVVGVAMRTGPFNMVVPPMPVDAARALGRSVAMLDDTLPGVTGSASVLDALIEGYVESQSRGSTRTPRERRRDLLYELEDLVTLDVEGFGRAARVEQIVAVAMMYVEFNREIDHPALSLADALVGVNKSVGAGSIFCWEVSGAIVAIAGHAPVVTTESTVIARVGPVFTPAQCRRQGYGSAVTAHVTRHLLERGARVMLFTDAANPTSNGIYQEIGYRLVDELIELELE
jgi:predicted GNAT family acetyltransferase